MSCKNISRSSFIDQNKRTFILKTWKLQTGFHQNNVPTILKTMKAGKLVWQT